MWSKCHPESIVGKVQSSATNLTPTQDEQVPWWTRSMAQRAGIQTHGCATWGTHWIETTTWRSPTWWTWSIVEIRPGSLDFAAAFSRLFLGLGRFHCYSYCYHVCTQSEDALQENFYCYHALSLKMHIYSSAGCSLGWQFHSYSYCYHVCTQSEDALLENFYCYHALSLKMHIYSPHIYIYI